MKRLVFQKTAKRRLALDNVRKQLNYIKYRAASGHRAETGWLADVSSIDEKEVLPSVPLDAEGNEIPSTFTYTANLDLGCISKRARRDDVKEKELNHIVKMVQTAGLGKGWELLSTDNLSKDHVFSEDAHTVVAPPKATKAKKVKVDNGVETEVVPSLTPELVSVE